MGQQQLLLVILVTIIVGIATVVAINIFGTAADQANRDAVRQDLMAASVQAQAIWARPTLMNGANRNFNGANIDEGWILERLNIPSSTYISGSGANLLENENGDYFVTVVGDEEITITGTPSSGPPNIVARVWRDATTQNWRVEIDGLADDDSD
ncbi:MAG: hypothetical protein EA359_07010 [Balneolaceae bacterium]|nr:MAG: hypothetical protein EA359_07010 [Balneolaceae bacterium]